MIAAPILALAILTIVGKSSIAAIHSDARKASSVTELSSAGFLDFKTLLYSLVSSENLDGVFNQIKFIEPEMIRSGSFSPRSLRKFKNSQSPLLPINQLWGWDQKDLDVLNYNVNGKSVPASSGLADAILSDIKDNIRNHGISSPPNSAAGTGTAAYFNSATQNLMDQIINLENIALTNQVLSQNSSAVQTVDKTLRPQLMILLGLGLLIIGLLRRWSNRRRPEPVRKAIPAACFEVIRNSPIQYTPKNCLKISKIPPVLRLLPYL